MTSRPAPAPQDAGPTAPGSVARLWLAAQHELAGTAAHEIRNALNGVSVNLTVVQSRLRREGVAESITRFADAASAQLDLLTAQVEALLALVRGPNGGADVSALVAQVVALSGRRAEGDAAFVVTLADADGARVPVDPTVVRTLVVLALAPALAHAGPGGCEVRADGRGSVCLAVRAGGPVALDPRAAALAGAANVELATPSETELVLLFPPVPATAPGAAKL